MMTEEQKRLLDPNYGNGSMLMRPEDSSIQGASEDFMKYLQNPTFGMMSKNGPEPIESYDAMLEQEMLDREMTEGKGTPSLSPIVAPQNKAPISSPNIGNSASVSIPTPPKQADILDQLKAARAANEKALMEAKGKDSSVELANALNKSFNQIGTGVANQAGYTKIASNPLEVSSNEVKFAAGGNKEKLDALMQEYGIKKGIDDTAYNRKKDEQDRKDRLNARAEEMKLKREEMDYKKKNDAQAKILSKEEVKEDIQIKKENRAVRRDLETAIPALEAQLKNIEEAETELKNVGPFIGTGKIDQYLAKFTDKGQSLERKLNKISLESMVKLFAGMSKAVDTNAERAMFQSTQPDMGTFENVNEKSLSDLKASVQSMIDKSKNAMSKYDREGGFTQPEEKQSNVAPKNDNSSYPKKVFNNKGQSATVSNAQEEAEAKSEGFN